MPTNSQTLSNDEEISLESSLTYPECIETILKEEAVDDVTPFKVIATCTSLGTPFGSSLAAAANMPYFGPTGRCKKSKVNETAELLKDTLHNLNKSIVVSNTSVQPPSNDVNNPDFLIGKNVESCLKMITNMALKLKYKKKFRSIIQDCEEELENSKIIE